jgi:hypothetical protein
MGSKPSKFDTVDDSVNIMIQHDKKMAKKTGQPMTGFVPQANHPLLRNGPVLAEVSDFDDDGGLNQAEKQTQEEN